VNGINASGTSLMCCFAIGKPTIVTANNTARTRCMTASSSPGRMIQMTFMISAMVPPGGSVSVTSRPETHEAEWNANDCEAQQDAAKDVAKENYEAAEYKKYEVAE
jgi:hypothetical protein